MSKKILPEIRAANKKAYMARYHTEHREELLAKKRAYYSATWDARQATNHRNRLKNREKMREYLREYRAKNKEKVRALNKAWCAKNKVRIKAMNARLYAKDPEKFKRRANERRAKLLSATAGDAQQVADFYAAIRKAKRITCYWCGKSVPRFQRHVDHIVPLSKGGAHAVLNLCCACKTCNLAKQDKLPADFHPQLDLFVKPAMPNHRP